MMFIGIRSPLCAMSYNKKTSKASKILWGVKQGILVSTDVGTTNGHEKTKRLLHLRPVKKCQPKLCSLCASTFFLFLHCAPFSPKNFHSRKNKRGVNSFEAAVLT